MWRQSRAACGLVRSSYRRGGGRIGSDGSGASNTFKTEELTPEQRLNGFEFKATTSVEPGRFRWWIAQNESWRDWQIGEIAPPMVLIKRRGVWSEQPAEGTWESRKPLNNCSDAAPFEVQR